MTDLVNEVTETITFADSDARKVTVNTTETIAFANFLAKGPYGVFGDVAFNSAPMSATDFASFVADRAPIGYSPFRDLVPGDYNYQTAYLMFVFTPEAGVNAVISAQNILLSADVPDVVDSGTVSVAAGGTTVTFARPFVVAPKVTVIPLSAVAATVTLTSSPSTTSFTVKVFNTSGVAIACDVQWNAIGY